MKKNNRLLSILIGLSSIGSLSGCLKDTAGTTDFAGSKPVIEQLTGANYFNTTANGNVLSANRNSYFLPVRVDSTGSFTDSVVVNVAGTLIGSDVTVSVTVDTAAFATFNATNSGNFTVLPSGAYSIETSTVTIKAGTRSVNAYVKFSTSQIDFTKNNILPISIKNVSGGYLASGTFGTIMWAIVPANQYSGLYKAVGQRKSGNNVYTINDLKYLYDFSGITAVQGSFPTAHGNPLPTSFVPNAVVTNCADQTIYLSIGEQMDLTIDPSTNAVTVSNDQLYGFGVNTYSLVPGNSTYNPSTHSFSLSYGFVDPQSGDSSVVSEVITRID